MGEKQVQQGGEVLLSEAYIQAWEADKRVRH